MFLETITAIGNDILIPINRIQFIYLFTNKIPGKENLEIGIKIVGDNGYWEELFNDETKRAERYKELKNIVGTPTSMSDILNWEIEKLHLTERTSNSLRCNSIKTVKELTNYSQDKLLRLPNIGRKSITEIVQVLERHRLSLMVIAY